MSSIATRVWAQQQLAYFPHTDVSGDSWQFVKKGICTSSGAAGGTTLIDTNGDSGVVNSYDIGTYAGKWVHIISGAQQGEWKRIITDSGAGTLTFEDNGFSGQIVSGVSYEIWTSPEPVVVVQSSSGATDCVDARRTDEVDDFWKNYWMIPITGSRRGEKAQITGSTQSTGTFVLGSGLSGALTAGDVCLLRKFIEPEGLAVNVTESYDPRPMARVNFSRGDGIVGVRGGTVAFSLQATPSGSLSATGSKAGASIAAHLLEAGGLGETIGTSMTVGAGSTTTAVTVTTGTGERCTAGMMVLWNGNATWVESVTDGGAGVDTVNVSPALPVAPAASDVLYATRMYAKSTTGNVRAVGFEWEVNGIRTTVTGCKGNVQVQDGPIVKLNFSFQVDHYTREIEATPYNAASAYVTAAPVRTADRVAYLDSTRYDIGGFTASPNTKVAARQVQGNYGINGRAGFQVTDYDAGGSFRSLSSVATDTLPQELRWSVRTAKKISVAFGGAGSTLGVRAQVAQLVAVPAPANAGGVVDVPEVWQAQDAGTATTNLTTTKFPDFTICLT